MHHNSTFQIYNASAGSGKTFTLVKEYLKILLISDDLFIFQKILAVTFTNKAAAEMKQRVLKSLQEFSEGKQTPIFLILQEETALEANEIEKKSKKILYLSSVVPRDLTILLPRYRVRFRLSHRCQQCFW